MAAGRGPDAVLVALGCAGWGPGQLEREIAANAWLTCPADAEIIFQTAVEKRWRAAVWKMGIDPALLADTAGHA
jgi:putative transcriptional regulator